MRAAKSATWLRRDPLALRFEGDLDDLPPAQGFYERRFLAEAGAGAHRRGWLAEALLGRRMSIAGILAAYQRSGTQPTAAGLETIDTPFPHVIAILREPGPTLSQQTIDYALVAEARVGEAMALTWSRFVDPLVGCRARVFPALRDEAADAASPGCLAFVGDGIFAPHPGESPIGWVRLAADDGEVSQPTLPNGQSGGLYRGQSALAFAGDGTRAPAVSPALDGVSGLLGLGPTRGADGEPAMQLAFRRIGGQGGTAPVIQARALGAGDDPAIDARFDAFVIRRGQQTRLGIDVCRDARGSRLFARPPARLSLAIVGLVEPRGAARWWFDLDRTAGPRLCASAMTPARRSVVVERDGAPMLWDWARPGARSRPSGREFWPETITRGEERFRAVFAAQPLGWLKAPHRARPIALGPSSGDAFALDWLDFAGAARLEGKPTLRWAEALLAQPAGPEPAFADDWMPGEAPRAGDGEVWTAPPGRSAFTLRAEARLEPGSRFLVGGLLLEGREAAP